MLIETDSVYLGEEVVIEFYWLGSSIVKESNRLTRLS